MRGAVLPCPPHRRRPRRTARLAAVAAGATAAVLAGMLTGQGSASGRSNRTTTVAYDCAFPSGARKAAVAYAQDYPAHGSVGAALRPGRLTAEVTLPAAAVTAALPAGTAQVAGTAVLTAEVSQNTSRADAAWPDLSAPATPLSGGADPGLTFTGAVPPVTVTAPGTVRFAAGALVLTLRPVGGPGTPGAPVTSPGAPSATPGAPTGSAGTPGGAAPVTAPVTVPGGASLVIAPRAASAAGAPTGAGGAPTGTDPATSVHAPGAVTVRCAPEPGQQTGLGAVQVTAAPGVHGGTAGGRTGPGTAAPGGKAAASAPPGTPAPSTIQLDQPPHSGVHDCETPPKGVPDPAILASVPRPPQATPYPGPGDPPYPPYAECGYITGFANVGKLHGASTVNDLRHGPQRVTVVQTGTWSWFGATDPVDNYFEIDSIADLRLPPADSAFLTFGFMPTTAKMALTTEGLLTVVSVGTAAIGTVSTTTIYGKQDLRLYDVEVNGTAMDVGPDCHTEQPLAIRLVGIDSSSLTGIPTRPQDYSVNGGGPLAQKDLYIPPFTGCRSPTGEDLDALFTSSISGHGNSLNLIQGPLCVPIAGPDNCEPEIPFPTPPHH